MSSSIENCEYLSWVPAAISYFQDLGWQDVSIDVYDVRSIHRGGGFHAYFDVNVGLRETPWSVEDLENALRELIPLRRILLMEDTPTKIRASLETTVFS